MRSALLVLATLMAGLPSFAASSLRPEIAIGAPPRDAAASTNVSVASAPGELFAVWNDRITGASYGSAIGPDGVARNSSGIRLSAMSVSDHDAIAWTGEGYVVALRSCSRSSLWCTGSTMLIDGDGVTRRDPVPFGPADVPIVKANGSRVLLISDADRRTVPAPNGIFFLGPDGKTTLLKPLSATVGQCVAFGTSDGFVVYVFENGIDRPTGVLRRLHIDNSGGVTESAVANLPPDTRIAAATNGSDELLVWTLPVSVGPFDGIQGAVRLTTSCELVDSNGKVNRMVATISDNVAPWPTFVDVPAPIAAPTVTWDGARFAVAYVDYDGTHTSLKVTAVSADGRPTLDAPAIADQAPYVPTLSRIASTLTFWQRRYFLFWSCSRGSTGSEFEATYFRALDGLAAAPAPPVSLAGARGAQSDPAVSTDGNTVAVAWCESQLDRRIMAQVMSSSGLSEPVALSDAVATRSRPAVASGGAIHLVAWTERDPQDGARFRVAARRLSADGRLLDPAPIVLDAGTYNAAIVYSAGPLFTTSAAWDGSNFLISWTGSQGQAFITRVSPQGERLERVPLAPGTTLQYDSHLIRIGERVMALYQSRLNAAWWSTADVNGVWLRNGAPETSLTFASISLTGNDNVLALSNVLASYNGRTLAIVWRERGSSPYTIEVTARSFSPDGYPLTPPRILLERALYMEPLSRGSLIADRSGWWYVARSDTQPAFAQKLEDDLKAGASPIEIAPGGNAVMEGDGVSLGGNIVLVYSRLDDSGPGSPSQRLFMQWLLLHPRDRAVR